MAVAAVLSELDGIFAVEVMSSVQTGFRAKYRYRFSFLFPGIPCGPAVESALQAVTPLQTQRNTQLSVSMAPVMLIM